MESVDGFTRKEPLKMGDRPTIFDERNRAFWEALRRFLIWLLRELDKWYGWSTDPSIMTSKSVNE